MRILFVVPYAPTQIRTRPYNFIRALAAEGHNVTLATLCVNDEEEQAVRLLSSELENVCATRIHPARSAWNSLVALSTGYPMQALFSWRPELARSAAALLSGANFDVIHVEHLRGARYGLSLKHASAALNGGRPAIVWDSVDCISSLFRQAARESSRLTARIMARAELHRTERYETALIASFDRVVTSSENDRAALADLACAVVPLARPGRDTTGRITVVPNGVDSKYFSPGAVPGDPLSIVISGKMSYHANITAVTRFVDAVMPKIWSQLPDVRLWIVGKDPPAPVRNLGMEWKPGALVSSSRSSRVRITGTVDDIRPYLRGAALAVAPILYGAGIQNKVLEAMACGLPVIATSGAASGLRARHGRQFLIAHNEDELASFAIMLLNNPEMRAQLGRAGRAFVEQEHDWRAIARQLARVYQESHVCA